MRGSTGLTRLTAASAVLLLLVAGATAKPMPASAEDRGSLVIAFKDGHRQTFAMAEIARIDFKAPSVIVFKDGHQEKVSAADIASIDFEPVEANAKVPGRAHFIGKWEVAQSSNGGKFFITLAGDGDATKSIGASHGTWTVVDGEARISWDDGWHDAIRKVGSKYEKVAFEPGKSFSDTPSNVTAARNTQPKPI